MEWVVPTGVDRMMFVVEDPQDSSYQKMGSMDYEKVYADGSLAPWDQVGLLIWDVGLVNVEGCVGSKPWPCHI
jgi:hypothetical protein